MAINTNMTAMILHMDGKNAIADSAMKMVSTYMMMFFFLEGFMPKPLFSVPVFRITI